MGTIFYHLRIAVDYVNRILTRWKWMFSEKVAWWNTIVRDMNYCLLIGAITINILLENDKILSIGIIVFLIFLLAKHRNIYFKDFGLKNPSMDKIIKESTKHFNNSLAKVISIILE